MLAVSQRRIAREFGVNRKTVRRDLAPADEARFPTGLRTGSTAVSASSDVHGHHFTKTSATIGMG